MSELAFYVLGPVLVASADGPVSPGGPTTRAVLCSLLTNANKAVPAERIAFDVWGDDSPGLHALQSHITRLRSWVGPGRIASIEGCYRLAADGDEIDARRFERLVAEARAMDDPEEIRRSMLAAFDLWRGVPFADLADREFLRLEVLRLEDLRLNAIEMCMEADLQLGRHYEILGSLRAAVAEFPYHERMWAFLIRALEAGGRQPEALATYQRLAALLEDELGITPNEELRGLRDQLVSH